LKNRFFARLLPYRKNEILEKIGLEFRYTGINTMIGTGRALR